MSGYLDDTASRVGLAAHLDHDRRPLSYGLVIGLGGAGIQTISRVKNAVQGNRPDAAAAESVRFLGIDAVKFDDQVPPLPPDHGLDPREFLNITEQGFEPLTSMQHLRGAGRLDWWDPYYQPPRGDQTQGLRRSRMLGRLAWLEARAQVGGQLQQAMNDAVEIRERHVTAGQVGAADAQRLKVFIVASAVGGTGSSGFLEVVNQLWQNTPGGITPEIRAILYLPGVFYHVLEASADRNGERAAHRSNAYAFFRELDHFVGHGDELVRMLEPGRRDPMMIGDTGLLEQVFLVDNVVQGRGQVTKVTDVYATVAETIYHLIMSDIGRPVAGAEAVNQTMLGQVDAYGKPRRYCGLGVARLVYPSTTYERHVRYLFAESLLRHGLLHADPTHSQLAHEDAHVDGFLGSLDAVLQAPLGQAGPAVNQYLGQAGDAPGTLAEEPSVADVDRLKLVLGRLEASAVQLLGDAAQQRTQTALRDLPPQLERAVLAAGLGLPYARAGLRRVHAEIVKRLERAIDAQRQAQAEISSVDQRWDEQRRAFRDAAEARLARVLRRRPVELARGLGQMLESRARAIVTAQSRAGETDLLRGLQEVVEELDRRLEASERELTEQAWAARRAWQEDTLQGKDAGARETTSLIPSDVLPEIEDSRLSRQVAASIRAETEGNMLGEDAMVGTLLIDWYQDTGGPFALGDSQDPDRRARAQRSLNERLNRAAERHALLGPDGTPRLPESLAQAAASADTDLGPSINSVVSLSQSVWLAYQPGVVRPAGDGEQPAVFARLAAPAELVPRIQPVVGDATRVEASPDHDQVVALSFLWGLPVHALSDVRSWKVAYEATRRARRLGAGVDQPPPHIDQRLEDERDGLVPLIPKYFDEDDAIRHTAMALLAARVTRDVDRDLIEHMFDELRPYEPVPVPVVERRDGSSTVYVSAGLVRPDRTWRPTGQRQVGDLLALIEHLGQDMADMRSVVGYVDDLERTLGAAFVQDHARALAQALQNLVNDHEGEFRDALWDLARVLQDHGVDTGPALTEIT